MFGYYHWEACSFLKGNGEGQMDVGERARGEDLGGVEGGETGQDVLKTKNKS